MMGLEIVKNRDTKEPDAELFGSIFEKTKDYGLLLGKGGRFGTTFRIQPPMCITEQDVEFSLDVMERSISESV
jgi:alanine-glyoxylate transaminase/(R)-3-amino-2-methylpropionate-pyruvate transaminase